MVATWWFIRNGQCEDTLKLAALLLGDKEDLIHKATGWMLREAGKCDVRVLRRFLKSNYRNMPRTMLRYAIERFPASERMRFLQK
jgi:3-methyladenine DNA glycosylase AlkD